MPAILLLIALLAAGHIKTGEACRKKVDILLTLDSSSTVCGGDEPCQNWEAALQFSKNITTTLDIGSESTRDRVALMTFANTTVVQWNLKGYTAKNPLLSAIGGVAYEEGEFYNLTSVSDVYTKVFSPAAGDDVDLPLLPARKNVLFMITDGIPIYDDAAAEAASLVVKNYGITYFLICITTGCTESWAKAVTSDPEKPDQKTYFLVDSYSSLNNALKEIVLEQLCYFLEDPPPPSPTPLIKINLNLTVG